MSSPRTPRRNDGLDNAPALVRAQLDAQRVGVLLIHDSDGSSRATGHRYVVDGRSGRLVMAVDSREMKETSEATRSADPGRGSSSSSGRGRPVPGLDALFCVPEEEPEAMQLSLVLRDITDDPAMGYALDRWAAYFDRPLGPRARFVDGEIISAKLGREVVDGEDLDLLNPLLEGHVESRLVKLANAERGALVRVLQARGLSEHDRDGARCVGVDPRGIDVRAGLGVRRIEFPARVVDEASGRAAVAALLGVGP